MYQQILFACTELFKIGGWLSNQSGRVSKIILEQPGKISPKASACGMFTALNTWRMTFKKKSNGLG
jgi:hypothetical protein